MARKPEVLDDTPLALPVRIKRMATQTENHRQFIQTELSRIAEAQGLETFEESQDFDVDDDFDPRSPWEEEFDPDTYESSFRFVTAEEQNARNEGRPWPPPSDEGRLDGNEDNAGETNSGTRKQSGAGKQTSSRKQPPPDDDDGEE